MKKKRKKPAFDMRKIAEAISGKKIRIPEKLRKIERVPTGIPGVDELIRGGFERNSVVIITGGPGTGKSTFAIQFLYNGAVKYGENGLYITFEEEKEKIFAHMGQYGWDLEELEKKKRIIFLEYPPHEVDRFMREGGIIEDLIHEYKIKRISMDSVTSFLLLYENEYRRREAFLKTIEMLRKWECTAVLTSEGEVTARGEVHTKFGIEFLSDGLVAIHSVRRGDIVELAFEIVKLRGTQHTRKLSPMKFTSAGLKVYPKQPVFTRF